MVQPLTVVIKLGSSSILHPEPPYLPQIATLSALAETCVSLRALGHRVVIVSSGAIGMGMHRMELPALTGGKKRAIGEKQALAAIGQGRLIALWDQIFGALKQPIAQILMTRNDIADRSRYLNATTTLSTLLGMGVIPIINENDTISVSEILHVNKFGDNDTLSAIAAGMCGADYLFLMTDVDGLYEDNPRRVPDARRVAVVRDIEEVRRLVSTSTLGSSLGTGGMETKLIAAELATAAGCATVITMGAFPARIVSIVQAHQSRTAPASPLSSSVASLGAAADPGTATPIDPVPCSVSHKPGVEFALPTSTVPPHTLFTAKPSPLSSRRFWILHGLTPRGTVYVDEGAYRAIALGDRDDGGSGGNGGRLLAAGVLRVEGTFAAGQAVRVCVVRGRTGNKERRRARASEVGDERRTAQEEELVRSVEALDVGAESGAEVQGADEGEGEEEIHEFGRGLTNYNSIEIDRVKGLRSSDIERVLSHYDAEHVVESIVELRLAGGKGL
ncbi:Glutamate 5-kinase [Rhodotorula kratochvilovae]